MGACVSPDTLTLNIYKNWYGMVGYGRVSRGPLQTRVGGGKTNMKQKLAKSYSKSASVLRAWKHLATPSRTTATTHLEQKLIALVIRSTTILLL